MTVWARALADWALPQEMLDAADESPYGFSPALWRRRNAVAAETDTATTRIVHDLAPVGSVLDIGAGTGRSCLPLARLGHPVTALERNSGMADGLRAEADGLDVTVVDGAWPDDADDVGTFDIVMSANVVYDVPEIERFLVACRDHATVAVVVEMTHVHPWVHLGPLYREVHDLDRPDGPGVEDLIAATAEAMGRPDVTWWERGGGLWFETIDEILDMYGKRLLVPVAERASLRPLLEPMVTEVDGRLVVGEETRRMATLVWRQ